MPDEALLQQILDTLDITHAERHATTFEESAGRPQHLLTGLLKAQRLRVDGRKLQES